MPIRPFRFGIITETFDGPEQLVCLARRAEESGFASLLIRDHLAPDYFGPQFAPLPTLAYLAAITTRLRLSTMVIANDFRHPTVLAKEAATLDVLSGGRFELGIGAGWLQSEYERAGIPYDRNGVRIDRLEEALQIIRACFTSDEVSFAGDHYRIDRHLPFPAPSQTGGPPILVGAGQPRMLRLAGRFADIVGLLTVSVSSGELRDDIAARRTSAVRERIGHVRSGAGERFDAIELSLVPDITITDDRGAGLDQVMSRHGWVGLGHAEVEDMPAIFVGSVDEICEQMESRRADLGVSYYVIPDRALAVCRPIVERLAGR
jgi:probable F420-dependent oxidoreductase